MDALISYNELLYKKASEEFNTFLSNMKKLPPDEIIEQAYEKVIKQDLLLSLEERELPQEYAYLLYKQEYPLDFLYNEWLHNDLSYNDILRDTIDDCISHLDKLREDFSKIDTQEMINYGYTYENMVPVSLDEAKLIFLQKGQVYKLYPDDTECQVQDISEFDDTVMYGVEKSEICKFS